MIIAVKNNDQVYAAKIEGPETTEGLSRSDALDLVMKAEGRKFYQTEQEFLNTFKSDFQKEKLFYYGAKGVEEFQLAELPTPNRSRPKFNIIGVHNNLNGKVHGIYTDLTDQEILNLTRSEASELIDVRGRQDFINISDYLANAPSRSSNNWAYLFKDGKWQTYRHPIKYEISFAPKNLATPKNDD